MPSHPPLALAALALLFTIPLRAAEVTVEKAKEFDPSRIKRVAFLPMARALPRGEELRAACPVTKRSFDSCAMEDAAEAELSRALARAFLGSGAQVQWIPQSEINAAHDMLKKEGAVSLNLHGSWQAAIGKELSADAVIMGFIYCYRDRSGTAYASARPAAVGFCLHLVDPATGEVLWTMRYSDEQRPLSEDLLALPEFIKRKGRWIRVEQMAEEAATRAASELPWKKKPQEKKVR